MWEEPNAKLTLTNVSEAERRRCLTIIKRRIAMSFEIVYN